MSTANLLRTIDRVSAAFPQKIFELVFSLTKVQVPYETTWISELSINIGKSPIRV